MKISRQTFLKTGAVVLIGVAGGGVYRAADQGVFSVGQGLAYEPWKDWRNAPTAPERIVSAGILAANPHNSQPWHFRIREQAIDLYADTSRQIGVIDPFQREMHIGLGCALENMMLAAQAEGFTAVLSLLHNETEPEHVAHLTLTAGQAQVADLYTAIPNRHTNRSPYDLTRAVAPDVLTSLAALVDDAAVRVFWYADSAARDKFSAYGLAAAEALIADEQQSIDSGRWWRQQWSDVQAHQDGITIDAQSFNTMTEILAKMLPDGSRQQSDAVFVQNTRDNYLATASAFGLIAVRNQDDNTQRMRCGQIWQRMQLWATVRELAMQPLNQICERADRERQQGVDAVFGRALRDLTGGDEWQGIMPFRVGYATRAALASPRRAVQKVLL
ncbi:MAG: Acg family FMN-binding oxidoreductase [Phototrophicaceae bacterium]